MNGFGRMRKKAGLTQKDASEKSGIALSTLRRWEQGVNEPDVKSIVMLANLYGCTTDDLLETNFSRASVKALDSMDPRLTEIVEIYDAMSGEGRRALLASARGLAAAYPGEEAPVRVAGSA